LTPLDQARHDLAELRTPAVQARQLLASPEWEALKGRVLGRILDLVSKRFDGDANRAAFALGQVREAMLAYEQPLNAIAEFEEMRERVETLEKLDSSPR
jgi:hypothetical protein